MKRRTLLLSAIGAFVSAAMGQTLARRDRVTSIEMVVKKDLWAACWPVMKGQET